MIPQEEMFLIFITHLYWLKWLNLSFNDTNQQLIYRMINVFIQRFEFKHINNLVLHQILKHAFLFVWVNTLPLNDNKTHIYMLCYFHFNGCHSVSSYYTYFYRTGGWPQLHEWIWQFRGQRVLSLHKVKIEALVI